MPHDSLGPAIKKLREQRGLSLEGVARKINRSKQHVHNIEVQKYGTPLSLINEVVGAIKGRLFLDVRPEEEGLEPAWLQPAIAEVTAIAGALDEPRRERLLKAARAIASIQDPVSLDLAIAVLEHHAGAAAKAPVVASPPAEAEPVNTARRR